MQIQQFLKEDIHKLKTTAQTFTVFHDHSISVMCIELDKDIVS